MIIEGEVIMLDFIKPYLTLLQIVVFAILISITAVFYTQKNNAQADLAKIKSDFTKLESKCTQTSEEYQQAKEEYKQAKQINNKESQTKITYITKFKKDDNETNCEAANRLIRTTSHGF